MLQACDLYDQDDKQRLAVDTHKRVIHLYLKLKQLSEAIAFTHRFSTLLIKIQNKNLIYKNYLSTLVMILTIPDEVEASKQFELFCAMEGFLQSDEGRLAHDLIESYEKQDPKLLEETLKKQHFTFLEPEVYLNLRIGVSTC